MDMQDFIDRIWYKITLYTLKSMSEEVHMSYHSVLYMDLIYFLQGKATVSRISELLKVSKPGVTMRINRLVQDNLVIKTLSLEDKRVHYLRVNEEKTPYYMQYQKYTNRLIEALEARYSPGEREIFCNMLAFISQSTKEES